MFKKTQQQDGREKIVGSGNEGEVTTSLSSHANDSMQAPPHRPPSATKETTGTPLDLSAMEEPAT